MVLDSCVLPPYVSLEWKILSALVYSPLCLYCYWNEFSLSFRIYVRNFRYAHLQLNFQEFGDERSSEGESDEESEELCEECGSELEVEDEDGASDEEDASSCEETTDSSDGERCNKVMLVNIEVEKGKHFR